MKILIAGGTGFIGRALARSLAAEGHEVTVLSRRLRLDHEGIRHVRWDGYAPGPWQQALEGMQAVVNLCGEGVADSRWTPARKIALRNSRLLPTRALVSAMAEAQFKPEAFVSASAVGYYGDRGDEELTEASGPGADFLVGLCAQWEAEALQAEKLGIRTAVLRTGVVLGQGGGALAKMAPPFKLCLGGPLGDGRQWLPWVSREDVIGLIRHILQRGLSGPVNATAPNPLTNRDFSAALGKALNRPSWLPAPAFALRLALGEMAGMLLGGQRAIPRKALDSGYRFLHPNVEAALKAALS